MALRRKVRREEKLLAMHAREMNKPKKIPSHYSSQAIERSKKAKQAQILKAQMEQKLRVKQEELLDDLQIKEQSEWELEQMRIYSEQEKINTRQRMKDLQHARKMDVDRKEQLMIQEAQANQLRSSRSANQRQQLQIQARRKAAALKDAVMKGRAQQIQEKIAAKNRDIAEEKKFSDLCVTSKADADRFLDQGKRAKMQQHKQHQAHLRLQIEQNQRQKAQDLKEEQALERAQLLGTSDLSDFGGGDFPETPKLTQRSLSASMSTPWWVEENQTSAGATTTPFQGEKKATENSNQFWDSKNFATRSQIARRVRTQWYD